MSLLLNCDLGEDISLDTDEKLMPFIDQANIACGFHAGSPSVMASVLKLAKQHNVTVGAHPSYPDRKGFGRTSMSLAKDELIALIHYQIAAFDGLAQVHDLQGAYVKPHGALYNDMMAKQEVRLAIMQAVAEHHRPVALFIQSTADAQAHKKEAEQFGIDLKFEVFADRCYADSGLLLPRGRPQAIHTKDLMLAQIEQLIEHSSITSYGGKTLQLEADTLCIHGDNPIALQAIDEIRSLLR